MTSPVTTATTYIKVMVTDSRGRTTTKTKNVSASAYTKPSITVTAIRYNSSGTATTMGTYVKITVNWSITNLTGNAVNGNIITYKSSGGTYTSANSKAVTGTSGRIVLFYRAIQLIQHIGSIQLFRTRLVAQLIRQ